MVIFILFLRIRLSLNFQSLFTLMNKVLKIISKVHFDKHRAFSSILTMTITNSKKVLMKCLTYIWSQYEIILILFICIMNTESFTSWICKSCNDIIFYDFKTFLSFLLLKPKWMSCRILNSIMIIYPLIWEWCRLRNTLYDSLNWAWHRIYIYR
jgi:hypothetical protein